MSCSPQQIPRGQPVNCMCAYVSTTYERWGERGQKKPAIQLELYNYHALEILRLGWRDRHLHLWIQVAFRMEVPSVYYSSFRVSVLFFESFPHFHCVLYSITQMRHDYMKATTDTSEFIFTPALARSSCSFCKPRRNVGLAIIPISCMVDGGRSEGKLIPINRSECERMR